MTTMTAAGLSESLLALIDARLDTIERMLMGRVSRSDRVAILGEVESQIHELLADRDLESLTREDVLDVLRRLDPPEAYLTNMDETNEAPRIRRPSDRSIGQAGLVRNSGTSEGRIGGILGMCSLGGFIIVTPLCYLAAVLLESEVVLIVGVCAAALFGIAGSIAALTLSIRGRNQGTFPIIGLVTSSIALPVWALVPISFFILLS